MSTSQDELYLKLLDKALDKLPRKGGSGRRLEDISLDIVVAGKRTVINNFREIAKLLNRDPRHLAKFILKELAVPGMFEDDKFIIQAQVPKIKLANVLQRYIKTYVLCPVCGAPDTVLVREKRLVFMICTAWGAKSSVPSM